jgi:hypothetical protein
MVTGPPDDPVRAGIEASVVVLVVDGIDVVVEVLVVLVATTVLVVALTIVDEPPGAPAVDRSTAVAGGIAWEAPDPVPTEVSATQPTAATPARAVRTRHREVGAPRRMDLGR